MQGYYVKRGRKVSKGLSDDKGRGFMDHIFILKQLSEEVEAMRGSCIEKLRFAQWFPIKDIRGNYGLIHFTLFLVIDTKIWENEAYKCPP